MVITHARKTAPGLLSTAMAWLADWAECLEKANMRRLRNQKAASASRAMKKGIDADSRASIDLITRLGVEIVKGQPFDILPRLKAGDS